MANPYEGLGAEKFWKSAVATAPFDALAPLPAKRFRIPDGAKIATAGSCFAQNVGRFLKTVPSVRLLIEEEVAEGQPIYSAAYGNIYTARQLLQLFEESTGARSMSRLFAKREDGRFVDALRPNLFAGGFASPQDAAAVRAKHLSIVKHVLVTADVFVFTFGLTEAWIDKGTATVLPLATSVYAENGDDAFHNFSYAEVLADAGAFIRGLRALNPRVKFIFTVSPVPLTATYSGEHVLVATMRSKAILRAACDALCEEFEDAYYFPSFDMIWNPFFGADLFGDNRRNVTRAAVDHVMAAFASAFLGGDAANPTAKAKPARRMTSQAQEELEDVVCDEEDIERSVGF
jgi:hypothetical protein